MIVVMAMAGRGSRFSESGVTTPKPLISVAGKPMFSWAVRSLKNLDYSKFVAVVLEEHQENHKIENLIEKYVDGKVATVSIPDVTQGQLCSVLAAKHHINTTESVLVIPSDTLVVSDLSTDILNAPTTCHGIISVGQMPGDHWSFARLDDDLNVLKVAEKIRISDYVSTGLYYFKSGKEFVTVGEEIVSLGETTMGEYYVIPVYNKYLERGWNVRASLADEIWDMGNPGALSVFLKKHC